MSERIVIEAKNIDQIFKVGDDQIQPLQNVNFTINESSFNIIYGPSGSGKSTLLNVLMGLQKPTSGSVLFNGKKVYDLSPDELAHFRATSIGFVYQSNYWIKSLNVAENVAVSLYFTGYSKQKADRIALNTLEQVGMAGYAEKNPALLSGGEQQRVAMARALTTNPPFLIADEPTGGLDTKNGDNIIELLRLCQTKLKRTVILVTHNMEYLPLADHLLHIQDGKLEELKHSNIAATTTKLMEEMENRIKKLARTDKNG